jgi:hypothetical protein
MPTALYYWLVVNLFVLNLLSSRLFCHSLPVRLTYHF